MQPQLRLCWPGLLPPAQTPTMNPPAFPSQSDLWVVLSCSLLSSPGKCEQTRNTRVGSAALASELLWTLLAWRMVPGSLQAASPGGH